MILYQLLWPLVTSSEWSIEQITRSGTLAYNTLPPQIISLSSTLGTLIFGNHAVDAAVDQIFIMLLMSSLLTMLENEKCLDGLIFSKNKLPYLFSPFFIISPLIHSINYITNGTLLYLCNFKILYSINILYSLSR